MRQAGFNLFIICTHLFSFVFCEQSGGVQHQTLHPVDPGHTIRRQLAKAEPTTEVSLYYAQSSYKDGAHYAATVKWILRYPALVASDQSDIHEVECGAGGIHIAFGSQSAKLKAESWLLPMVIITDGDSGNCAYDGAGSERYHPILLNSRLRSPTDTETASTFSGLRTRWNVVASEHEIKIGHVPIGQPPISIAQSAGAVRHRRSLPTPKIPTPKIPTPKIPTPKIPTIPTPSLPTPNLPTPNLPNQTTFSFAPSLNYDRQRNTCSIREVPINLVTWAHGSLDLKCTNCYLNSNFRLTLETGSRILNFGISSIAKIVDKLHQAEATLKATVQSAAQAAQKAFLSRFTRLGEQLTDALSEFYNRVHDLAISTNVSEKAQLQTKINQSATLVRQKSQQLLTFTVNQFQASAASAPLPPAQKSQVIQQVRQVVSSTDAEVRAAIANGTQIAIDESQLAECTPSQEQNLQRRGLSCKPRNRRTTVGLNGHLKANIDVGLKLKGTGEIGSGDLTLFSASLVGVGIPGIVQVGPQVRFISHTALVFTSSATLSFGADFEWQNVDAVIDSNGDPKFTKLKNSKYVFNPHTPKFDISPQQLSLEQHFKPQINFGIELLLGAQELLVGIGADVGFINTLQYSTKLSQPIPDCKGGIKYDFNVTAELDALVSVPKVAKIMLAPLLPSIHGGVIPLLKMTPFNILKHCFKLPSSCSSPSGWISKPNSLGACFAKISSSDL